MSQYALLIAKYTAESSGEITVVAECSSESEVRTCLISKVRCCVTQLPASSCWDFTCKSSLSVGIRVDLTLRIVYAVAVMGAVADEQDYVQLVGSVVHEVRLDVNTDSRGVPFHPVGIRTKEVLCWRLETLLRDCNWLSTRTASISPRTPIPAGPHGSGAPAETAAVHSSASLPICTEAEPVEPQLLIVSGLTSAAADGDHAAVSKLLEDGVSPEVGPPTWTVADGGTALIAACRGGHTECVESLLAAGARTCASDFIGRTGYDLALRHGFSVLADEMLGDRDGGKAECGKRWLSQAESILDEWSGISDSTIMSATRNAVVSMVNELVQAAQGAMEVAHAQGYTNATELGEYSKYAEEITAKLSKYPRDKASDVVSVSAGVPTLPELFELVAGATDIQCSEELQQAIARWHEGEKLRVSGLPQSVLEELVELGCTMQASNSKTPRSVFELKLQDSMSFIAPVNAAHSPAPAEGTDEDWIGKAQYLELLKTCTTSVLDELLSTKSTRQGAARVSGCSSAILTVGMVHAVIARANLAHGLAALQSEFVEAESAIDQQDPTAQHAIRVVQTVQQKTAVWMGLLDLLSVEHAISDSACVRGIEIEVLRLIERGNAALMALQSLSS